VDIYALAASFYYAVTGQKPTPSMERRLENRPLKSPKEINRNLSDHLNTAITLGMSLEKGDRPQSMSDWLQQLELPPPAVEPQYRQETVNLPRSVKPKKESDAIKQKINPQLSENSIQKKLKDLSWGGIGGFLVYGISGYFLWIGSTPLVALALAVGLAVAWAGAVAWAWGEAMGSVVARVVSIAGAVAALVQVTTGLTATDGGWVAAGVVVMILTVTWTWFLNGTSMFDLWKNNAWFDAMTGLIFFVILGMVSAIISGLLLRNILHGINIWIGSTVIFFIQLLSAYQFLPAYQLYKKKI